MEMRVSLLRQGCDTRNDVNGSIHCSWSRHKGSLARLLRESMPRRYLAACLRSGKLQGTRGTLFLTLIEYFTSKSHKDNFSGFWKGMSHTGDNRKSSHRMSSRIVTPESPPQSYCYTAGPAYHSLARTQLMSINSSLPLFKYPNP